MPVPSTIDDLSTVAGSNSPAGTETPTEGDNYIRTLSAFIAQLRDMLNGTSGDLSVAGNTVLGNAQTDTLNVGNGDIIKDASGNVGIGGTPTVRFEVFDSGADSLLAVRSTDSGGARAYLQANSNVDTRVGSLTNHPLLLVANSQIWGAITADGRLYGTALHNNAGSVSGATNQYIASGTYTPGATGIANVSATTPRLTPWLRVGNVVTVGGQFTATFTSSAAVTTVTLTLPVGSSFTAAYQASGSCSHGNTAAVSEAGLLEANAGTATVTLSMFSTGSGSQVVRFHFTYEVL